MLSGTDRAWPCMHGSFPDNIFDRARQHVTRFGNNYLCTLQVPTLVPTCRNQMSEPASNLKPKTLSKTQTTMLIDVENYRVLLLGAFRPREKYCIFFPALPIAFPHGIYVFITMSEPWFRHVGTWRRRKNNSQKVLRKKNN